MPWYKTGTVKTTINSNAIIGTGTAFISNSRVGDAFRGPDGNWYEVVNIASNTAMSISPNYQGPTVAAGTYSIAPMQGYVKESADALRAASRVIGNAATDMSDQVNAAKASAADALASKNEASASAESASTSAATATTKATEAASSASTATTQADVAKTEADRARTAANEASNKQPLNANLTAFSGLAGLADRLPYFTGAGALSLATLTAKARLFNARTDTAGMQAELGLVPVTSSSDITPGRILTPGWMGLGGNVAVEYPDNNFGNAVVSGFYRWYPLTTGAPVSDTYGTTLRTAYDISSGNWTELVQSLVSTRAWFRSSINSSDSSFAEIHTTFNSQLDPELGTGGLMSSTVVSGFRVDKYANGSMCVTGKVTLPTIPANEYPYQTLNLPVTFLNTANMQPSLTARGLSSIDMFGVISQLSESPSSVTYAVRNGGTTQGFEINVTVWGTWK